MLWLRVSLIISHVFPKSIHTFHVDLPQLKGFPPKDAFQLSYLLEKDLAGYFNFLSPRDFRFFELSFRFQRLRSCMPGKRMILYDPIMKQYNYYSLS